MEVIVVTALICGTVIVLLHVGTRAVENYIHLLNSRQRETILYLKGVWEDTLTAILTEVDFSFSPRLVVELGGAQAAVAEKGVRVEELPLEVMAFIAKDSSPEARADLVTSAHALRNSEEGGMDWQDVLKGLKVEVESRGW